MVFEAKKSCLDNKNVGCCGTACCIETLQNCTMRSMNTEMLINIRKNDYKNAVKKQKELVRRELFMLCKHLMKPVHFMKTMMRISKTLVFGKEENFNVIINLFSRILSKTNNYKTFGFILFSTIQFLVDKWCI